MKMKAASILGWSGEIEIMFNYCYHLHEGDGLTVIEGVKEKKNNNNDIH